MDVEKGRGRRKIWEEEKRMQREEGSGGKAQSLGDSEQARTEHFACSASQGWPGSLHAVYAQFAYTPRFFKTYLCAAPRCSTSIAGKLREGAFRASTPLLGSTERTSQSTEPPVQQSPPSGLIQYFSMTWLGSPCTANPMAEQGQALTAVP